MQQEQILGSRNIVRPGQSLVKPTVITFEKASVHIPAQSWLVVPRFVTPMFVWEVSFGVHNDTAFGFAYFIIYSYINILPFFLLETMGMIGTSGWFSQGGILHNATTIQGQVVVAIACLVWWMTVAGAIGFAIDLVNGSKARRQGLG